MYYAETDNGIISGKTLKEINSKLKAQLDENEMRQLGPDRVIKITEQDLEFIQDKKRMSRIPIEKLFRKNNTLTLFIIIIMALQFIVLVKK